MSLTKCFTIIRDIQIELEELKKNCKEIKDMQELSVHIIGINK